MLFRSVQHFKGVGENGHGQCRTPGFEAFEVARPVEVEQGCGQFAVDIDGFGRDGRAVVFGKGAVDGGNQRRIVFALHGESGGSGMAAVAQGSGWQVARGTVQERHQWHGTDGAQRGFDPACFAAVGGDQRRAGEAAFQAGGKDADDAFMPGGIVGSGKRQRRRDLPRGFLYGLVFQRFAVNLTDRKSVV